MRKKVEITESGKVKTKPPSAKFLARHPNWKPYRRKLREALVAQSAGGTRLKIGEV